MHLRYALMADHANVTQDGKLNAVGVLDRLFAPRFPAVHRQLFLVTCIETQPQDDNMLREIRVELIDPDAKSIARVQGSIQLGAGKQIINQMHVFADLKFDVPGSYEFHVFCDGDEMSTLSLDLVELPPGQTISM